MNAPLVVRDPMFDFDETTPVQWTPACPELATAANAVSVLMPYLEPYFVRITARAAETTAASDDERDEVRHYLGQETQHQRHHRAFNRALIAHYPRLRWVESTALRWYRSLERRRSLGFNMAFVAASETVAYAIARWADRYHRHRFTQGNGAMADLFVWHLAEEVEHKSVAHTVYRHWLTASSPENSPPRHRDQFRYFGAATLALISLGVLSTMAMVIMLIGQRRVFHPLALARLFWWSLTLFFEVVPLLVLSGRRSYDPGQMLDPPWYEVYLREYDSPTRFSSPG